MSTYLVQVSFEIPIYDSNLLLTADVQASCEGVSGGAIDLMVSGGNEPYSYNWGELQPNAENGLLPGAYSVTVTDACGTEVSATYVVETVSEEEGMITVEEVIINKSCGAPSPNGSIYVTASTSPGGSPLSYNWSNGGTSYNVYFLLPGNYSVTISNSYGCELIKTYTVGDSFYKNHTVNSRDACGSNLGSISISSFPTLPELCSFYYEWSNGNGEVSPLSLSSEILNLTAGNYCVTITEGGDCWGVTYPCYIVEKCFTIEQDPPKHISNSNVLIQPACGGNNGFIAIEGLLPADFDFEYLWSNGETTNEVDNLAPGEYCVTITSENSRCPYEGCYIIEALESPVINVDDVQPGTVIVISVGGLGTIYLTNGSIHVSVEGGASPYTYEWSDGSTEQNLLGVKAGEYVVTVTGDNGCTAIKVIIIPECYTNPPVISLINTTTPAGGSLGSVDVSVSSPNVSDLTYEWVGPDGFIPVYTQDLEWGISGEYTLTVTNSCNGVSTTFSKVLVDCALVLVDIHVEHPCLSNWDFAWTKFYIKGIHFPNGENYPNGWRPTYTFEWGVGAWTSLETTTSIIIKSGNSDKWIVEDSDARVYKLWGDPSDYGSAYGVRMYDEGCPSLSIATPVIALVPPFARSDWYWKESICCYDDGYVIENYFNNYLSAITTVNDCTTCMGGGNFEGPSDCKDEDNINSQKLKYTPNNYNIPCSGGGTITINADASDELLIDVPVNWLEVMTSGGTCACLFPAGLIPQINLPGEPSGVYTLPVYVEFSCTPEEEDPMEGFDCPEYDCEAGCQYEFDEMTAGNTMCGYDIVCQDGNEIVDYVENPATSCYKEFTYTIEQFPSTQGEIYAIFDYCVCEEGGYEFFVFSSVWPGAPWGTSHMLECPCTSLAQPPPPFTSDDDLDKLMIDNNFGIQASTALSKSKVFSPSTDLQINLFPNPFNNKLNIVIQSQAEQLLHFSMLNVFGQEVMKRDIEVSKGKQIIKINMVL